jgi:hypothetical protein
MAKPTKYAPLICTICMILAIIGIILGLLTLKPLIPIFFLLPTVIYEVYRTEGESTRASSIILLVVLIAEVVLIVFRINFNLAEYLDATEKTIGGYLVPLGDIKIVGPIVMAVLSVILFVRTYGPFTKWLAVVIFVTSFAIIYTIDPLIFKELLKYAVKQGVDSL